MSITLFNELLNTTTEHFIGFGNPDSNILILGKECAGTEDDFWAFTVKENAEQWRKYIENPLEPERCIYPEPNNCRPNLFSPRFAFKGQLNLWDKGRCVGGTSLTWLRYQKLIDPTVAPKSELTFQNHCFLTELSDVPKPQSDYSIETSDSIRRRVDSFLQNNFFKSFSVVLAACGSYVQHYQINLQRLFPNSIIIVCRQLSRGITNEYLQQVAMKMNYSTPGLYPVQDIKLY